jgi:hypothetical protein
VPSNVPPPGPFPDLPGVSKGKIETYWLAPYVRVSEGFGGTTITWFAEGDRQQRMQNGVMRRINSDPKLKSAYETLVKDVPEEQREEVMAQMARQKQRTVSRSQAQHQSRSEAVGV